MLNVLNCKHERNTCLYQLCTVQMEIAEKGPSFCVKSLEVGSFRNENLWKLRAQLERYFQYGCDLNSLFDR